MDTTSAAAAPAGEGSAFGAVHIKQEPGGQSDESPLSRGTEGDGPRTIRKITVLDPLKLKLLSRQNHNKLLSGLSAAKAKAQPPAPKPPPPPPLAEASPSSSGESAAAEKETQSNVTAQSESEALRPKAVESTNKESATATTIPTAPPKSGAGGGSSLFRRKKVVPVAIARKLAQKEKTKPVPKELEVKTPPETSPKDASQVQCEPVQPQPVEEVSHEHKSAQPASQDPEPVEKAEPAPVQPEPVEQPQSRDDQAASPASPVVVKRQSSEPTTRPTAFRRIKPKVAICLNPSRPKKSILKKTSSADRLLGPSKSAKDLVPEETIVLDDDDDEDEEQQSQRTVDEEDKTMEELDKDRLAAEEKKRVDEERRRIAEEQSRIEEEAKRKADEQRRVQAERREREEAEQRRIAEEQRRMEEEEKRKVEEQRKIQEEQRKREEEKLLRRMAEEQRRIEEEQKKKAEEQRKIQEEQRKREEEQLRRMAEEQRRMEEEEKKKAAEQYRIQEEQKKQREELRRIQEEQEKQQQEEQQRKITEEKQRLERLEQDRKKTEEGQKAKQVVPESRKTIKIPPEIWKRQLERMKNNPHRQHSSVAITLPSSAELSQSQSRVTSDSVTVEKSNVSVQEPVNVGAPVNNAVKPEPAVQVTANPTKEIRRISRLPPSLAMKLMNSGALNSSRKKPQQKAVQPVKSSVCDSEPVHAEKEASSSTAAVAASQTTIKRISSLPASTVVTPIKTVEATPTTPSAKQVDKEEQKQSSVAENAPAIVESIEKTEPAQPTVEIGKPKPVKEIKRIALPPGIALKLLGAVSKAKPTIPSSSVATTSSSKTVAHPAATIAEKPVVQPAESSSSRITATPIVASLPIEATVKSSNPNKQIRRMSQLPPNVAMRLVDSLKQKGIIVPKLTLKKEAPPVESPASNAVPDVQLPSEPSTPSSIASVPDIKVEPQEPMTKSKRKVEILSQVILPTASYNLEELLAGKSTEGFAPSDAMPLPLPMPKGRRPAASPAPVASVPTSMQDKPIQDNRVSFSISRPEKPVTPAPIADVPPQIAGVSEQNNAMLDNEIASEVTVTTEIEDMADSLHAKSDEYIISESEVPGTPVQYEPTRDIQQPQKERIISKPHVTSVDSSTVMSHQYSVTYSQNSHQMVHRQNVQNPVVVQQPANVSSGQPQSVTIFAKLPNNSPRPAHQQTPITYHPQFTVLSQPGMQPTRMIQQRMVLNPVSMQSGQRPRFPTAQIVLVQHPTPIRGRIVPQTQLRPAVPQQQQSQQHLTVPRAAYFHHVPISDQNKPSVIVPTPRYVIPKQYHQLPIARPQRPQRPNVAVTFQDHNKAFQPVAQSQQPAIYSIAQPVQQPRIIPKIVIDSSYVDQQERSTPGTPTTPPVQDLWNTVQNKSPCSEEIRNKLRDKLKSRMMQQTDKPAYPTVETPPVPPPTTSKATPPKAPVVVRHPTMPVRNTVVYHPQDFQQPRMQANRSHQQPPKPADSRVIKQYICQGRKIYLTKISVTKPTTSVPSNIQQQQPPQQYLRYQHPQSEAAFHGFPQATIKSDQRSFQQFSETVQQLEQRKNSEPVSVFEIQDVHKLQSKMRTRKPSVVTAVTTHGLKGETFIITELNEHPLEEVPPPPPPPVVKEEVPLQHPPRITKRRNTFVVDDSDGDIRVEQLPRVDATSQDDSQDDKSSEIDVKVKIEDEEKELELNVGTRFAFDRHMKEEDLSDSESSQADEDLAREILALVENERKALRVGSAVKKVKKRRKRRKRHKKKKEGGNEELMDLLMKHVNQESLIADIVATQQKKLPIVEISDTDESDGIERTVQHVQVKPDPDAEAGTARRMSCSTDVGYDLEDSETEDIFAEILKPFVEEDHQTDNLTSAANEAPSQVAVSGERTAKMYKGFEEQMVQAEVADLGQQTAVTENEALQEQSIVPAPVEATVPEKVVTSADEEVATENRTVLAEEVLSTAQAAGTLKAATPEEQIIITPEEETASPVEAVPVEQTVDVPKELETPEISTKLVTEVSPVIESNHPVTATTTICDQTCDNSALLIKAPSKKAPAPRAPKRKLKPTLVSRSKIRKLQTQTAVVSEPVPQTTRIDRKDTAEDNIEDSSDPFSDRDEPAPEPEMEDTQTPELCPTVQTEVINSSVRELVNEWDSDEGEASVKQPLKKYASFDNNGNLPCRISKNNVLKRSAMLSDPVLVVPVEENRNEVEPQEAIEHMSEEIPCQNVKSVRVSVLKEDLMERPSTPEPAATIEPVIEEKTPTPAKGDGQTVERLLKDWEDSPIKQQRKADAPQLVARVLLDSLSCDELISKTAQKSSETVTLTEDQRTHVPIDPKPDSRDEISNDESETIVARIFLGGLESPEKQLSTPGIQQPTVKSSPEVQTGSPSKSHENENQIPNIVESSTTRSRSSKQTSIKDWIQGSPGNEPSKSTTTTRKKGLRGRASSVLFDPVTVPAIESQKPAGRNLRSRTKSVFAEKPSLEEETEAKEDARPVEESSRKEVEATIEMPSDIQPTEVMKEAGGTACAARKEKEEPKECSPSTTKPAPIVRNRVPIQISSEDEDDAPLAKRRKVLRKRRSMMRQRSSLRDLSANKRLFRGGATYSSSLIADGCNLGETTVIKTEPPDVVETSDYYPAHSESFAVSFADNPSEQLLSVVTVQNNQVVHAQDFDTETPLRNQYFARDFVQSATTSTPVAKSPLPPPPVDDHVFATPEPVRAPKRKRRTKQEMENDRNALLLKGDEEQRPQEPPKKKEVQPRARQQKAFTPVDVEAVDPSIREFECGSCFENIPRENWDAHYMKHSGLTYRVNVDPPVELNDETTAVAIVTRFMKTHRQVLLYCDKCNVSKKSALGLVSHRPVCGMTRQEIEDSKIPCQHCGRKLMPVSMNCHLFSHCAVLKRKKQEEALEKAQELEDESIETSGIEPTMRNQRGTVKRQATARAEKLIQNLSFSELIVHVSKDKVTDGCLATWRTQFRKAKVALCVFKTCSFTGTDESEMRHHHEFCPTPCELLECKNCKFQTEHRDQMVKHIKMKHTDVLVGMTAGDSSGTDAKMTSESSDDDGTSGTNENEETFMVSFDDDDGKPKKRKKSVVKTFKFSTREQFTDDCDVYREMILDEMLNLRMLKSDFHLTAREWITEFRRLHYSQQILFPTLRPDLDVRFLTFNMAHDYLPKQAHSLRFTMRSTNLYNAPIQLKEYSEKWQHLEAFTGQVNEKESIFYCGGPVVALDWMPVPDGQVEHQILAVACKNDFEEFYMADRIFPVKCLIQIWDMGVLDNKEVYNKKLSNSKPTLMYSIACDFGPIWALKFCPSGCYNSKNAGDDYDRLGLLAAAGSDGNVHIFSLGRSYEHLISNSCRVVKMPPVLKLTLSMADESCCSQYESHSVVKLSWSKSKNHSILAAGYSNGTVAVWNLTTTSPLLTGMKDNVRAMLPVHKVFIPDSCVTAVDLHYTDDARYLLVCNADRKVVVYDLDTGYLPMEVCSLNARSKVTTACWNTHFPLITMAFDDVYAIDRCALTFHQPREIGLRLHPLYTFTAEATDMSSSDHLSTHVIGTDGGDVLSHKPMAYVHNMGQKNPQNIKYVLTSTLSVKVHDEPMDNSYAKFERNYCVLFSDHDKNPARMDLKSLQVKTFRRALLHEYPGIRINQVQWNPNDQSHQYYAIGYQAGFVRVRPIRLK